MLWFDVESKYEATPDTRGGRGHQLWFDVESKYEATQRLFVFEIDSCGLM